jgi:hypothetical protein
MKIRMVTWRKILKGYTIKRVRLADLDEKLVEFLIESLDHVNEMYGRKFDWHRRRILDFARSHYLGVCYHDKRPVGFMAAILGPSTIDPKVIILKQELLFAKSPRATVRLLEDFIDFGKAHANHVITVIGEKTNIKSASLEKLGFSRYQVMHRMEILK